MWVICLAVETVGGHGLHTGEMSTFPVDPGVTPYYVHTYVGQASIMYSAWAIGEGKCCF